MVLTGAGHYSNFNLTIAGIAQNGASFSRFYNRNFPTFAFRRKAKSKPKI